MCRPRNAPSSRASKLANDDRKQLEIGTVAPLQVVQDESSVASDRQALISAQSSLNYQQQIIKQAIARNLNDASLSIAPVIPTDRVTIEEIPEEQTAGRGFGSGGISAKTGAGTGRADAAQ